MAIYRMLEGSALDPETVNVIARAYEDARVVLRLKERDDPLTLILASKILEVVRPEDRDPIALRDRALALLRTI